MHDFKNMHLKRYDKKVVHLIFIFTVGEVEILL